MNRGKCPPGVLCIENITFVLLIFLLVVLGIIIYNMINKSNIQQSHNKKENNRITSINSTNESSFMNSIIPNMFYTNPNSIMSNRQNDILLNPYAPPLKDNRFLPTTSPNVVMVGGGFGGDIRGNIPIPIQTQGGNVDYRQVGLLTRNDGSETILPLFGRPLYSNRNKWQYYATKDNNTMIKLPLSKNGRSCTNEYGCDELFNGDTLYVEGYKDAFNATIYETNQPSYVPF
jgi:hypothetical protein